MYNNGIKKVFAYMYFGVLYISCKITDGINKMFCKKIIKPTPMKYQFFKHSS